MGNPEEQNIEVIYDEDGKYLIKLGDSAIEIDQDEANQLMIDLATALRATYYKHQAESKIGE